MKIDFTKEELEVIFDRMEIEIAEGEMAYPIKYIKIMERIVKKIKKSK